jgi:hypothetical protein
MAAPTATGSIHGAGADSLRDIDFEAWSAALGALATAIALDETQGNLRSALISLLRSGAGRSGDTLDLCATGDISARIAGDPDAQDLLRRVLVSWTSELSGRL